MHKSIPSRGPNPTRRSSVVVSATIGLAGAAAAAVLLVAAVLPKSTDLGHAAPETARSASPTQTTDDATVAIAAPVERLAAYVGPPLEGFSLLHTPVGYVVQAVAGSTLVLAEEGDTTRWEDFKGKLVVSLASPEGVADASGSALTIHGAPALLRSSDEASSLQYVDNGRAVMIQVWNTVGLSDEDLALFAEGLSVSSDAGPARG